MQAVWFVQLVELEDDELEPNDFWTLDDDDEDFELVDEEAFDWRVDRGPQANRATSANRVDTDMVITAKAIKNFS